MPTARTIQTDFKSGEIDPLLKMRTTTAAYASGCERLRNCIIFTSGAIARRPGTRLVKQFSNLSAASAIRLLPFEFSSSERYLIAMFPNRLEFFSVNPDGTITDLNNPIDNVQNCPWNAAQIPEVTYAQVADTMIICHKAFQPRVLKRVSLTAFQISRYDFTATYDNTNKNQPYYKFDQNIRLRVSSVVRGASATLTSSAPFFTSRHVGSIFRIYGAELLVTAYTNPTTVTVTVRSNVRLELDPNPIRISTTSAIYEFTAVDHGLSTGSTITCRGANGILGYANANTAISSIVPATSFNTSFSITVLDQDRFSVTGATTATTTLDGGGSGITIETTDFTSNWDEQAFSDTRGWPAAVCFHENRLWFAGTTSIPDGVFASKSGLYYDFNVDEGNDGDSIQFTVGSSRIAAIRHIVSNRILQIFSDLGEYAVNFGASGPITPANVVVRQQTPYGCSAVAPESFDGSTLYVQANGQTVREFVYVNTEDGFVSTDLTAASSHLINKPVDMAVLTGTTRRTEQYALLVNSDGTIAVFHSSKAEGLAAWTLWNTAPGHSFRAVCAVDNRLFALVTRRASVQATGPLVDTMTLEEFAFDDSSVTLDCSLRARSANPTTSWGPTSLTGQRFIYNGNTVSLTSGGVWFGDINGSTLNGSTTQIPSPRTSLDVGFSFTIDVKTLPPEFDLQDGPITGAKRRINRVLIGIDSTLSMTVQGQAFVARQITDNLSQDPLPQTGKQQFYMLGYSRDPFVSITQDAPLPIRITGLVTEVSV